MSATFGNPDKVRAYLEEMARRYFTLFETENRVTKLVYKQRGLRFNQIHDALVFAFSKKGVEWIAAQIAKTRRKVERDKRARLREMSQILEVEKVPETMLRGVGTVSYTHLAVYKRQSSRRSTASRAKRC